MRYKTLIVIVLVITLICAYSVVGIIFLSKEAGLFDKEFLLTIAGMPIIIGIVIVLCATLIQIFIQIVEFVAPNNRTLGRGWVWSADTLSIELLYSPVDRVGRLQELAERINLTYQKSGLRHTVYGKFRGSEIKLDIDAIECYVSCINTTSSVKGDTEQKFRYFTDTLTYSLRGKIKAKSDGTVYYEQLGTKADEEYLQFLFDLLIDMVNSYQEIVDLGGKAIPLLQPGLKDWGRQPIVLSMLQDIAVQTSKQLKKQAPTLLCPYCLVRCHAHRIQISHLKSITYYGCRVCRQSQEFIQGQVVVVLDNQMKENQVQHNNVLRINWLAQSILVDFDRIEILQSTDEEVERFAVQVGNDTDLVRKSRYRKIPCIVSNCSLSENTLRILRRMFGSIETTGMGVSFQSNIL
ncbi:MAG: hypothetical protein GY797_25555 [Deltaproteobacteria bacterium]|nr:hypothetical protein [Deltaproteobacteria bacterium]